MSKLAGEEPQVHLGSTTRFHLVLKIIHVHLRLLEAAAVVHVDRLPLRVGVQGRLAGLSVAVASAARATEGEVRLSADGAGVDVDEAGIDLIDGAKGLVDAPRVDGAGEAVGDVVVDGDGV